MAERVRVFVSHHRSPEEDAFSARLVADLEVAGAAVWVNARSSTAGAFIRKINEGLAGRQWLVLVMTPAALRLQWIQREVNVALRQVKGRRMLGVILFVPFVMAPCDEALVPPGWARLQRYDATSDYPAARDGLLRALGLAFPAASGQPASRQPAAHTIMSEQLPVQLPVQLPTRLAALGFAKRRASDTELILPPMVTVPAGEFLMGTDPQRDRGESLHDETPQHWLTLAGFQIARYPVTVAEYVCFVRAGQQRLDEWRWQLEKLDHPVVSVSWHDAVDYAAWLAGLLGQPWRLPSEAQWEKAARWDQAARAARIYPWGDAFDPARANTHESHKRGTTPVGSYPSGASPCGAQDMAGNVWEWTGSLREPYPYPPGDWKESVTLRGNRVRRGGSWDTPAKYARAACRISGLPEDAYHSWGFRLVLAVTSA
jgi:formylglycine-generating enzyme required for sulfatase activity